MSSVKSDYPYEEWIEDEFTAVSLYQFFGEFDSQEKAFEYLKHKYKEFLIDKIFEDDLAEDYSKVTFNQETSTFETHEIEASDFE